MSSTPKKIEVKFAFAGDFNEIYKSKLGTPFALVDGKWHVCSGDPWYEPDYPIKNEIVIVTEFTED